MTWIRTLFERVRALVRPPVVVPVQLSAADIERLELEAPIRESEAYLRSIKGKHAGKRGFVIGNGPSLRMSDLDLLQNEICIASNKIYLAFERTKWRPTVFTVVDDLIWQRAATELHHHVPRVLIPSYLKLQPAVEVEVVTVRNLGNAADTEEGGVIPFSPDAGKGMYGGYTVTYENLQLAVHMGLNPIYLLGCDHFYEGAIGAEGDAPVSTDGKRNHFLPNYTAPGDQNNPALVTKMTKSYKWARHYADLHGVKIFNATRGGHLEVFQRVDLDTVIG